jgi:uncharacterized protein GlcG (DUF336 family)
MSTTVRQTTLAWQAARAAAGAAADKAEELGVPVNVAVVDGSGLTLAFLRQNGAPLHSVSIAEDKAYTAVSFGLPTAQWHEEVGSVPRLWDGLTARERFCVLGGGLPIRVEGDLVGGIGVSGGTEEQDEECADAALAVLGLS